MSEPLDADRMGAWRGFLRAHRRVVDQLAEELAEAQGLPLAWYDVLVNVAEAPERTLRMSELAQRVLLSQSGLTRLVDRMTDAGLVDRRPCPSDRRGLLVVLTPQGYARLREAAPVHLDGVARHFGAHLGDEEARVLRAALERISEAMSSGR